MTDGNVDHASSRIRAIQYITSFQQQGWQVHWIPRIAVQKKNKLSFVLIKRWLVLRLLLKLAFTHFDIIIIQRRLMSPFFLKLVKKRSRRIIFDIDDAIFLNKANRQRFEKTVHMANQFVVSTPELKAHLLPYQKEISVIYSSVNADLIPKKQEYEKPDEEPLTIIWTGSAWTSVYLGEIEAALQEVAMKINLKLITIGASPELMLDGVSTEQISWNENIEAMYLPKADIGVMPLSQNVWERYKGGYKLFLYMAAGLPLLASPVGINRMIVQDGENGFLPESKKDWVEKIILLGKDSSLRKRLGQQAHQHLLENYEFKVCVQKWIALLEHI